MAHEKPSLRLAASTTLHCLTGCMIGELIGLIIGISLGWQPLHTMSLAVILAFISGLSLASIPLAKRSGIPIKAALRIVLLGEIISISVMELFMNSADYWIGGVTAMSVFSFVFWQGFLIGALAGYIAALPINYYLLQKGLKKCH